MKRLLLTGYLLLTIVRITEAQDLLKDNVSNHTAFLNDISGRPLYMRSEMNTVGSTSFYDQYCSADIYTWSGRIYLHVNVKFDLLENELRYISPDGIEMVALTPVSKIVFHSISPGTDSTHDIILTGENDVLNKTGTPVYQLLDTGKANLFVRIELKWRDDTPYGQAGITRIYEKNDKEWWVRLNNTFSKVDKNGAFFQKLLADKKTEINSYISRNSTHFKSLSDVRMLIQYYNSLFTGS